MLRDPEQFDFFVSYARADNAGGWISGFVEELLAEHESFSAGRELKPFVDQHAITNGADWQLYIAHGVAHSRLFLAFVSPSYLASEWCRKEWRAWIDAEIAQHILTEGVRPIYIVEVPGLTGKHSLSEQQVAQKVAELCRLPEPHDAFLAATSPVVKQIRRRDFSKTQVQSFFTGGIEALRRADLRAVLETLAKDLDHHAGLLRRADESLSTVPAYNAKFTGRLDELLQLREQLIKDDRTGIISGVHGLGGIGKTELAFTYAHAFASAYPGGRFIIGCENKSTLRDAVLGQGDFLALFRKDISDEERKQPESYFAALVACLRERLASLGHVLLVLDNVTDPALLTTQQTDCLTVIGPDLHLLATTRLAPPGYTKGNWLTLVELPEADALELLEKHRPFASDAERHAANRIVKRLAGFSIAIELVAAWLAKHREVTCQAFLQRLGLEDLETLNSLAEERNVELRRHNHGRRLDALLGPTLDALMPEERLAMDYAAELPPDCIAWEWLEVMVGDEFPKVAAATLPGYPDVWAAIQERVAGLSLLTEAARPELCRMHRLVQRYVQNRRDHDGRRLRDEVIEHSLRRCGQLRRHWRAEDVRWELDPLAACAAFLVEREPYRGGALDSELGDFLLEQDRCREAEPLLARALALAEAEHGRSHPSVAKALGNLGRLLHSTGRLPEAEAAFRRALLMNEQHFGQDHPDVGVCLYNLANFLRSTDRSTEAERMLRRAVAIWEHSFGPNLPGVTHDPNIAPILRNLAITLTNLGSLLLSENRLAEAETFLRRATAIEEQHFDPDDPFIHGTLNDLAGLLLQSGRLAEAEPMFQRALAISEKDYGPTHHTVAEGLNNIAGVLHATNRLTEAEAMFRRVLAIWEQSQHSDQRRIALTLNNLGDVLRLTNRSAEAEPMFRRALTILRQSAGENNPDFGAVLSNLAQLLKATNRLAEAEPLMRQALAIREQSLGPNHPGVAIALNNLARLLQATNRMMEAEPMMRRSLEILLNIARSTGHPHPMLRAAVNNYTQLLTAMGRSREEVVARLNELGPDFQFR